MTRLITIHIVKLTNSFSVDIKLLRCNNQVKVINHISRKIKRHIISQNVEEGSKNCTSFH